jgi:hypothetical protein
VSRSWSSHTILLTQGLRRFLGQSVKLLLYMDFRTAMRCDCFLHVLAPTKAAPIVRSNPETGEGRLEVAKWGLVPFFTKDLVKARKPINAQSETVAHSPLFKSVRAAPPPGTGRGLL